MKHVVQYSGGIGSWSAASRVIDEYDVGDVVLLFADVKGSTCVCTHSAAEHIDGLCRGLPVISGLIDPVFPHYCGCAAFTPLPHVGESDDSYRFIAESAWRFGAELVWLRSDENIWEVFHRRRYLGNSRQANCSIELKQKPCRAWLDANCDPADTIVYVGIDWSESHRIPAIQSAYEPFRVRFPMTEPPYVDRHQMLADCRASGVEPPAAYAEGWSHSNCQGGCVRAGKAHWKKLLQLYPERYAYHEAEEQKLRDYLGKDVAILTDTSFDPDDIGGCGCFTAETLPDKPEARKVPLTLRAFRERVESSQQGELFDIRVGPNG